MNRLSSGSKIFLSRLCFSGAFEQHGPHLPLGTDHLAAEAIAIDVARRVLLLLNGTVPALVAPHFAYGYKSQTKVCHALALVQKRDPSELSLLGGDLSCHLCRSTFSIFWICFIFLQVDIIWKPFYSYGLYFANKL